MSDSKEGSHPKQIDRHPVWCNLDRCSVEVGGQIFRGFHRSAVWRGQFDRHTGNAVEVFLWAFDGGTSYCQFEFPGSLHEGVELTVSQVRDLVEFLDELANTATGPVGLLPGPS